LFDIHTTRVRRNITESRCVAPNTISEILYRGYNQQDILLIQYGGSASFLTTDYSYVIAVTASLHCKRVTLWIRPETLPNVLFLRPSLLDSSLQHKLPLDNPRRRLQREDNWKRSGQSEKYIPKDPFELNSLFTDCASWRSISTF
jgi:hypothetical protein